MFGTKLLRWCLLGMLTVALWQPMSVGQGSNVVFVTAPELVPQGFAGNIARANFELQGVIPVASALSFPTAIVCAPFTGPTGKLYVAEFTENNSNPLPGEDGPETRIVEFDTNGNRGPVIARVPASFVVSMTLSPAGDLYMGTGVYPGLTEWTGIWRAPTNRTDAEATQVMAPEALQELLDLLETTVNPRAPEVRQLTFIPDVPQGRPFSGDLLFAAGAGTLRNWDIYRASVSGSGLSQPQKMSNLGRPWHNIDSDELGNIFVADFLNGNIASVSQDLQSTQLFAELVEPFQLAAASDSRVYVTTKEFEFDRIASGKKASTLWQIDRFGRLPVGASGAWGVTICS